jgi:hypothetical protein
MLIKLHLFQLGSWPTNARRSLMFRYTVHVDSALLLSRFQITVIAAQVADAFERAW